MTDPDPPVRDACDISVVIAVLNGAAILPTQLAALERQDFEGTWEVLICDNGSTDHLAEVVSEWEGRLPGLRLLDASGAPGDGFAKNLGMLAGRSDLIAICDADDVVAPEWLRAIHAALGEHALVTGPLGRCAFDEVLERGADSCFSSVEFSRHPGARHGLPYAAGCNMGLRRTAFPDGYDREHLIGSDGATSWRALRRGHSLGWAPGARILFRARPDGRKSMRRLVSAGAGTLRQDREFGDLFGRPSVFPFRHIGWCVAHGPGALLGRDRDRWRSAFYRTLGRILEYVAPGKWFELEQYRRSRGEAVDTVASVPASTRAASSGRVPASRGSS